MASFADNIITDSDWVDLYGTVGVALTSILQIQNKGSIPLLYQEGVNKPSVNDLQGVLINPLQTPRNVLPKAGEKIWVRAFSSNSVAVESTIIATLLG